MKYKNPTAAKDEIIFNESRIDWFKDVYLVEGAFDGFFLDNSIVMLGKKMIAEGALLDKSQLADLDVDLKSMLKK